MILTKVLLYRIVLMLCVLTRGIELYLVRPIPKKTDLVVYGLILTKILLNIIVWIELYLVRHIPKDTEGYLNWFQIGSGGVPENIILTRGGYAGNRNT